MQYKGNILLPIFNEEQSIIELISEIELHIKELNIDFVVTLVDDGSRDKSWEIIEKLDSEYLSFRRIKLTRNFGHQPAIFAGLENFNEDFVIILDADFYSGGDFDSMKEMLRDGRMVVEIRAKTGATKKNRGTVFRTSQKHMPDLFSGILL